MVWDNEKSLQLIKLYEEQKILWNHADQYHYDKKFKEEAWNNISLKIKVPVSEAKKKMVALMGSYRREKSRQKRNTRAGKAYVSKWFAYESLNFLSNKNVCYNDTDKLSTKKCHPEVTKSAFRDDESSLQESDQGSNSVQITTNPKRSNGSPVSEEDIKYSNSKIKYPFSNSKRKSCVLKSDKSLEKAIKLLKKADDDPYDIFGKYIANELRKYNDTTLTHVKKAIHDIIFNADVGKIPNKKNEYPAERYLRQQDYSSSRRCSHSTVPPSLPPSPSPIPSPQPLVMTPVDVLLSTPSPDNDNTLSINDQ